NAAYYSLAGAGNPDGAVTRGLLLGLAAGAGAVLTPGPLGLGEDASARTPATAALTIALYTAGGLISGLACRTFSRR
ncbi:MAG TPA: hypothetical protein VHN99_11535, partial [Deinococcales bacterium]|nr:hypothetical protein [Deinococcales bacterium]